MKRFCIMLLSAAMALASMADENTLLPRPRKMELRDCSFALARPLRVADPTGCLLLREFLAAGGCVPADDAEAVVEVEIVEGIDGVKDYPLDGFPAEGYRLCVEPDGISIKALAPAGVTRAAATLMQLAEGRDGSVPGCVVTDWPAFKLRGYMHDVGRSFIDVDELKHELDLLSRFKVNCFHWHLTENQAWRFEVKAYPQLTDAQSMTRFAGCFYTQQQCREVVEYAAQRGIVVIPEIDMPGHSGAFERAMGFQMQTDEGVAALKDILTEVCDVFALSPYIHIGADEQAITYPNFLATLSGHVHGMGKKVVMWNPIRGVAIDTSTGADLTQMWSTSGRAVEGLPNIDCRYNYANHFDVFADLVGIYKSNIYYAAEGSAQVAGTISAYWNDRKTATQTDIIRQNNFWANTLASAERAWTGGGRRYIEAGGTVLPNSGSEYDEFADFERRLLHHKNGVLAAEPIPYVRQTNVRWRVTDAFPNGGVATTALPPETEGLKESYTLAGQTYGTRIVTGAGVYLRHTWGTTVPATFANPQTGTTAYAWTYVYSPVEQQAGALIEFQNYGRSENDKAPDNGCWDRKGSRLWLNDEELLPPVWTNAGKNIGAEVDLGNENFTARPAYPITLRKGWNKVFVKLPYVAASGVRLNKWMWTFVVTDTEGRDALDGLVYSPDMDLKATYEEDTSYLPTASTPGNEVWYSLCTPLRGSNYATSCGAGNGMVGSKTLTAEGYWRFESRIDGTFDIVNHDGSYIAPTAAYNTQLSTVATQPSAGWEVMKADAEGYVVIVSGNVQMNQTSLNGKIYNWGGGANLSDAGCKYVIAAAPALPATTVLYSTDGDEHYYNMYTPSRGGLYATSMGADVSLKGQASPVDASAWKFVRRPDGTADIVNYADGCYVSPASAYNTALKAVATQPADGWRLTPVAGTGSWIITTAGGVQWNQTTNAHAYQVFNWGDGTNQTDAGCLYVLVEVDLQPVGVEGVYSNEGAGHTYTVAGQRATMPLRPGLYVAGRRKIVVK